MTTERKYSLALCSLAQSIRQLGTPDLELFAEAMGVTSVYLSFWAAPITPEVAADNNDAA